MRPRTKQNNRETRSTRFASHVPQVVDGRAQREKLALHLLQTREERALFRRLAGVHLHTLLITRLHRRGNAVGGLCNS